MTNEVDSANWETETMHTRLRASAKKRLCTWTFHLPGAPDVEVNVGLTEDLRLVASAPQLGESMFDTDMKRLFDAVDERLRLNVGEIQNIDWEPWLEIRVTGDRPHRSNIHNRHIGGYQINVQVAKVQRGVHRDTGEVFGLGGSGHLVKFPQARRCTDAAPTADTVVGKIKLEEDNIEVSYVPATPENERAIQDILNRMERLNSLLSDWLSQSSVEKNLIAHSHTLFAGLLTGPDQEKTNES